MTMKKPAHGIPQLSGGEASCEQIAGPYEAFPFPPVYKIEQEDPRRDLRESFNLDLGLGPPAALKPGSRIWVPGCGTRWAVMIALQFRDCNIVASDISAASLAFQQRLAAGLAVANITFRQEDLLRTPYRQCFDFISCVGVVHHLPRPDEGLRVLERALAANGLLELMVYDRYNRHYSIKMRAILSVLDPAQSLDSEGRFALALRLLRALNTRAKAPPELARVLKYVRQRPGFDRELADFISNPREHYYDVPGLLAALNRAGLRLWRWKQPDGFDPGTLLDDPTLCQQVQRLGSAARAHLGSLLSEPLLELYACKSSCQPGKDADNSTEYYRQHRLRSLSGTIRYDINQGGGIGPRSVRPKVTLRHDHLWFDAGERRPAVVHYGQAEDCITEEPRKRLRLADKGLSTVFNHHQLSRLLAWSEPGLLPQTLAEKFFTAYPDVRLSPSQFYQGLLTLCRTPFRLFALQTPALPQSVSRDAVERANRPPVA
ncbi:class I SAM-dependent methyltransferase [Sodalis praecaptivus]|uniref:class I SAM-dependent methyltransferase n=1 Tax=Sodalis praecaptivus TaxID=1239307 RepID=UPI0027F4042E|nr:class I SAM-dependent methyltransferase [Sodalis praecaptivus]CAJ0996314.1 hypothetical protein NVIRENTERO_02336 [Sodalis praecaptivus]